MFMCFFSTFSISFRYGEEHQQQGRVVMCLFYFFVLRRTDGGLRWMGRTDGLAFLLAEPAGHQFAVFGHGR
jgi:hypothetical protein